MISAQLLTFFHGCRCRVKQFYSVAPHLQLHLKHSENRCKQTSVKVTQVSLQHLHMTDMYLHDF